ncbi:MAG: hypothetical protein SWZ49_23730 [Cyanobacteriota bacterium]|nr:hypothetical protein [Cyanobacteriota bacterium]
MFNYLFSCYWLFIQKLSTENYVTLLENASARGDALHITHNVKALIIGSAFIPFEN